MKIVLFGDSITDMCRDRQNDADPFGLGLGYPYLIRDALSQESLNKHTIINRGIGGNRSVDLYARIKTDVWNLEPDVLSFLIGVNDVWHELDWKNGVDIFRYEMFLESMICETFKRLPNIQIIILEPFILSGTCTESRIEHFNEVREYAKVAKNLSEKYGLVFVPLQETFDSLAEKNGAELYLYDGVHPTILGARVIANAWLEAFKTIEE